MNDRAAVLRVPASTAMSSDTLSEVLRAVRLQGAVFFEVDATAPWVAAAPPAAELAPRVMPGAEHVIEYHAIVSGRCWGRIQDREPLLCEAGDVILFPQGDAHVMASAPDLEGTPQTARFARPIGGQLPIQVVERGGGEHSLVICGFLGCDARPFNPLLSALPRMLKVRGGGPLQSLMRMAVAETAQRSAGAEAFLSRVSELMFVESVRRYLADLPAEQTGWLAGLRDETVGKALAALHDRPAYDWTIDELGKAAGISRSALAERWTTLIGMPPMQYLTSWRMQVAAGMLAGGSAGVAEVAFAVGYGSEAAFSRAFKKLVGVPPATWRDQRRALSPGTAG